MGRATRAADRAMSGRGVSAGQGERAGMELESQGNGDQERKVAVSHKTDVGVGAKPKTKKKPPDGGILAVKAQPRTTPSPSEYHKEQEKRTSKSWAGAKAQAARVVDGLARLRLC